MLFVSRLGDLSVVLQRGAAPKLTKIAFQVAPHDDLPSLAKTLGGEGIKASIDQVSLPGIEKLLRFQDPKGTTIEIFNEARRGCAGQPADRRRPDEARPHLVHDARHPSVH